MMNEKATTLEKIAIILLVLLNIALLILLANTIVENLPRKQATAKINDKPIYFSTLEPAATSTPRIILMAEPTPSAEPTAEPTPEPTEEPEEEWITILATSYSSRPEENGGFGAVDCKYGQPLPENAIAANLSQFPYGTRLYIEGIGERVVVDTASKKTITTMEAMAKNKGCEGWIDVYAGDDYEGAKNFGIKIVKVRIVTE